jgi:hypothetical protein
MMMTILIISGILLDYVQEGFARRPDRDCDILVIGDVGGRDHHIISPGGVSRWLLLSDGGFSDRRFARLSA